MIKRSLVLSLLLSLGLCALAPAADKKPILIVVTNQPQIGDTGKLTGFYLSEAAHPWQVFTKAGYPVRFASPKGGFAPVDPKSKEFDDAANSDLWAGLGVRQGDREGLGGTLPLQEVKAADYAAVFFAGGHGAMWDFPNSEELRALTAAIYENGGVVAAVCHGPAALVNVKLADGSALVKGKKVAAFTNSEEKAAGLAEAMPFLLEDGLKKSGAIVEVAPDFQANAVRDGHLVTGQNPASAEKAAKLVVEALSEKR